MLNSAKIIPADQRKCAISEKWIRHCTGGCKLLPSIVSHFWAALYNFTINPESIIISDYLHLKLKLYSLQQRDLRPARSPSRQLCSVTFLSNRYVKIISYFHN